MKASCLRETLVLALAAMAPAALAILFHPDFASRLRAGLELGEVRLEEVRDWHAEVIWIDAREPEAFAQDHIPGAIPFDPGQFDRDLGTLLSAWAPERHVIVYCDTRDCDTARQLAARLRAAGLDQVHHLHGGWEAWLAAAAP